MVTRRAILVDNLEVKSLQPVTDTPGPFKIPISDQNNLLDLWTSLRLIPGQPLFSQTPGPGVVPIANTSGNLNAWVTTSPTTTTVDPTPLNDNTQGYTVGSNWINTTTGMAFTLVASTTGAAVWRLVSPVSQKIFVTGDITTTSTTFVLATGMTLAPTAGAGTYDILFSSSVDLAPSPAFLIRMTIFVSGSGTGTMIAANSSAVIVGSGTNFLTAYVVGQIIQFASQVGTFYTIQSITNDVSMTLSAVYTGTTDPATTINLMQDSGSELNNSDSTGFQQAFCCVGRAYVNATQSFEGRWRVNGAATATMYTARTLWVRRIS